MRTFAPLQTQHVIRQISYVLIIFRQNPSKSFFRPGSRRFPEAVQQTVNLPPNFQPPNLTESSASTQSYGDTESDSAQLLANRGSMWRVARCWLFLIGLEPAQNCSNSGKILGCAILAILGKVNENFDNIYQHFTNLLEK